MMMMMSPLSQLQVPLLPSTILFQMVTAAVESDVREDDMNQHSWSMIVVAGIVTLVAVLIIPYYFNNNKTTTTNAKTLPFAPISFWECVTRMSGPDAPWLVLELSKKMSRINFRLPLPLARAGVYVVAEPKLLKKVLLDRHTDKPRDVYKTFQGPSPKTLFTSASDEYAKSIRKTMAPAFSKQEVLRMQQVAKKHVDLWINGRLRTYAENGTEFDPAVEINRITFYVIMEAAFEYTTTDEEFEQFSAWSEIALREFAFRQIVNPLRKIHLFRKFFLFPDVAKAHRASDLAMDFTRKVLDTYRAKDESEKSKNHTIVKVLTSSTAMASEEQRTAEALAWMNGGHETTGFTISNTLHMLASHPKAQEKVRHDLLEAKKKMDGKDGDDDDDDGIKLHDVPSFQHVIQESKRLMPVGAMGSIRQVGRDIIIEEKKDVGKNVKNEGRDEKNNMILPKGAVCFLVQFLAHRNPNIFGPNADEFDPSRWEDDKNTTEEEKEELRIMKETVLPFALGSRNCPGQALAIAEINCLLPELLTHYRLEMVDKGRVDYFITMKYMGSKLKVVPL